MSKEIDLKEAERSAYRLSNSQDGLYDTYLGIYILILSTMPWMDAKGLQVPWNVILVLGSGFLVLGVALMLKKFMVVPRIGLVIHGKNRKKRLKKLSWIMSIFFLLTVGLFALTFIAARRGSILNTSIQWDSELDIVHTLAGIFIFGIFCLIGYMNDYPRLYLYGGLFGFGYILSTYLEDLEVLVYYWPWAAAGIIVGLIGILQFIRFMKDFPIPDEPAYEHKN